MRLKIQKALDELSKDKTVIMIAHGFRRLKMPIVFLVLQNGKLVEQGSAKELNDKNGLFASMLKNYLTSVKWKVAKEA